jgi:predicted lipase
MGNVVHGEPLDQGDGFVVWSDDTLPVYRVTTIATYWLMRPTHEEVQTIPQSTLEASIAHAVAQSRGAPVYVVAGQAIPKGPKGQKRPAG